MNDDPNPPLSSPDDAPWDVRNRLLLQVGPGIRGQHTRRTIGGLPNGMAQLDLGGRMNPNASLQVGTDNAPRAINTDVPYDVHLAAEKDPALRDMLDRYKECAQRFLSASNRAGDLFPLVWAASAGGLAIKADAMPDDVANWYATSRAAEETQAELHGLKRAVHARLRGAPGRRVDPQELEKRARPSGSPRPRAQAILARLIAARNAESPVAKAAPEEPLAKREFDPNVGGGVDRDTLEETDFAGPERSFPIKTPKDVSDAARSLGRTKHDPEAVKRRIIAIARRKGPDFEARLPASWGVRKALPHPDHPNHPFAPGAPSVVRDDPALLRTIRGLLRRESGGGGGGGGGGDDSGGGAGGGGGTRKSDRNLHADVLDETPEEAQRYSAGLRQALDAHYDVSDHLNKNDQGGGNGGNGGNGGGSSAPVPGAPDRQEAQPEEDGTYDRPLRMPHDRNGKPAWETVPVGKFARVVIDDPDTKLHGRVCIVERTPHGFRPAHPPER